MLGTVLFWFGQMMLLFHLNVSLISPSQPRASVLPSFLPSLRLHHNQTFVCILAHIHLTGCSWILFSDCTFCINKRSLKLEDIYEVSLDTNERLINNIISKTGCLLSRDSCKNGLPLCGRGQACRGGQHRLERWAHGRVFVCDPAPVHSCHTGPDVALHSCCEL